jgi:hypothetical protein
MRHLCKLMDTSLLLQSLPTVYMDGEIIVVHADRCWFGWLCLEVRFKLWTYYKVHSLSSVRAAHAAPIPDSTDVGNLSNPTR